MLLALALAQAGAGTGIPAATIAAPTPGLARIHACLVEKADRWLSEYDWQPTAEERWTWATKIVDQCPDGWVAVAREGPLGGLAALRNPNHIDEGPNAITTVDLLRAEARYYVDRLIREHHEARS